MPDAVELRIADAYVAVDPNHPGRCAVWQVPATGRGPHELVADDFKDRQAALVWLEYQRKTRSTA